MFGYIYKITNLLDGCVYIGKRKGHFSSAYWGSGIVIKQAIKKYGKSNFSKEVLCYCETQKQLNEMEKYYISKFDATNRQHGYNLAGGGDGGDTLSLMSGKKLALRNKRLSKSLKGHFVSEETRRKISEAQCKNWRLNKERRSKENALIRQRDDVRQKISVATKKKWEDKSRRKKASEAVKARCLNPDYLAKQRSARATPQYKEKMTLALKGKTMGWKFYNNGIKETRVSPEVGAELLKQGYSLGRLPFSDKTKKRISQAMKRRIKQ